jgi:hypothetical protein
VAKNETLYATAQRRVARNDTPLYSVSHRAALKSALDPAARRRVKQ